MDAVEELVVSPPCHNINSDLSLSPVAKGKRTKRHRPYSPLPLSDDSTTTEEEDTARCLILLAQGGHFSNIDKDHYISTNQPPHAAAVKGGGAACMYACKTCNRVFSSFQALGGHRTSHNKPKHDKKTTISYEIDEDFSSPSKKLRIPPPHPLSLQLGTTAFSHRKTLPSPRLHECSYCGAEFTSGQALGGHMRRHRAGPSSPLPCRAAKLGPVRTKPRNRLSLDLNFPAPEDENQKFELASGRQKSPEKLVLPTTTTPTLVDCHF